MHAAESASITVQADKPGITVNLVLYKIFFEEINRAGHGEKEHLQAFADFRTLIAELQQRTPARLNHGARFVIAGQSPSLGELLQSY